MHLCLTSAVASLHCVQYNARRVCSIGMYVCEVIHGVRITSPFFPLCKQVKKIRPELTVSCTSFWIHFDFPSWNVVILKYKSAVSFHSDGKLYLYKGLLDKIPNIQMRIASMHKPIHFYSFTCASRKSPSSSDDIKYTTVDYTIPRFKVPKLIKLKILVWKNLTQKFLEVFHLATT